MSGETARLTLKAATAEDRDAYYALFREVQEMHIAARPDLFREPKNDDAFRAHFEDAIGAPQKGIVLAWLGGEAVGAAHYEFTRLDASGMYLLDRPILWIESIAVRADLRGKGVGRALVGLLRRLAAERGVADLGLEVWDFNEDARRAFEALGLEIRARTMLGKV